MASTLPADSREAAAVDAPGGMGDSTAGAAAGTTAGAAAGTTSSRPTAGTAAGPTAGTATGTAAGSVARQAAPASARARQAWLALRLFAVLLLLALLSSALVVVPAGERGVLLRWGAIQDRVLPEGVQPLWPVVEAMRPMSVRLQSQILRSEAACRDLQDVAFELAVSWRLPEQNVAAVFRAIGDEAAIVSKVITPALEDGLKQVVASFTAEQLILERAALKRSLEELIGAQLARHDLLLEGIDLLQLDFSDRFRQAVEAKQVAEQDARRAEYEASKARRLAAARIYRAQGEAQAQQLLQAGLTPELLQHQAIEKWNGHLPLVMDSASLQSLNIKSLLKLDRQQQRLR
jgi:regulator of protease activity HflC (stomatin/prohibitin superfamily)